MHFYPFLLKVVVLVIGLFIVGHMAHKGASLLKLVSVFALAAVLALSTQKMLSTYLGE